MVRDHHEGPAARRPLLPGLQEARQRLCLWPWPWLRPGQAAPSPGQDQPAGHRQRRRGGQGQVRVIPIGDRVSSIDDLSVCLFLWEQQGGSGFSVADAVHHSRRGGALRLPAAAGGRRGQRGIAHRSDPLRSWTCGLSDLLSLLSPFYLLFDWPRRVGSADEGGSVCPGPERQCGRGRGGGGERTAGHAGTPPSARAVLRLLPHHCGQRQGARTCGPDLSVGPFQSVRLFSPL